MIVRRKWRKDQVAWLLAPIVAGAVAVSVLAVWGLRFASALIGASTALTVTADAVRRHRAAQQADRDLLLRNVDGADHCGRLPKVCDVRPDQLNVWPALPLPEPPGNDKLDPDLPTYVRRDIDSALEEAIDHGGLIVIEGKRVTGKDRIAYEAIKRNCAHWKLVIPRHPSCSLRELVPALSRMRNIMIYLDALEDHVTQGGLDLFVLDALCEGRTDIVIIATFTTKTPEGNERLAKVLRRAARIHVEQDLSKAESERAADKARLDPRIGEALAQSDEPFAQYLSSGAAALEWLRHPDGSEIHHVSVAITLAAVNYQRLGLSLPLTRELLDELHRCYLDSEPDAQAFSDGLARAMQPVLGKAACLKRVGADAYTPLPYLVKHMKPDDLRPAALPGRFAERLLAHLVQDAHAGKLHLEEVLERLPERSDDAETEHLHGHLLLKADRTDEALPRFQSAHDKGVDNAGYQAALLYLNKSSYAEAEKYLHIPAVQGNLDAQYLLGALAYIAAQSDHTQFPRAKQWLRCAADAGHDEARSLLHRLYGEYKAITELIQSAITSPGTGHTPTAAAHATHEYEIELRRAAMAGEPDSMNSLGVYLAETGRNTEALRLFSSAAERHGPAAANNLATARRSIEVAHSPARIRAVDGTPSRPTNDGVSTLAEAKLKFVKPFYRDIAQCSAVHPQRASEYGVLVDRLRAAAPLMTFDIAMSLWLEDWRSRMMASWWASVWPWPDVPDHVGPLLIADRSPFEGQLHCLALAQANSPQSRTTLMRYLDVYLPQQYRGHYQPWAMAALTLAHNDAGEQVPDPYPPNWRRWSTAMPPSDLNAYIDTLVRMRALADSVATC